MHQWKFSAFITELLQTIKIVLNGNNSITIIYGHIVFEVWHLPYPDSVVVVKGSKTITYVKCFVCVYLNKTNVIKYYISFLTCCLAAKVSKIEIK